MGRPNEQSRDANASQGAGMFIFSFFFYFITQLIIYTTTILEPDEQKAQEMLTSLGPQVSFLSFFLFYFIYTNGDF